ncbi:Flp pilus assembly protein CpaB [Candidatus Burkholderia verschuerenii]|uniref:Flp pilus assembly protein CpaB n=1 Tax=Candidatus Burkholderia verschuerenii TaxID=242163 RepID=UPI00067C56BB|nr:Flp pilus assembly protein CpaB [Candidatus Burkholderia verschuerenii]
MSNLIKIIGLLVGAMIIAIIVRIVIVSSQHTDSTVPTTSKIRVAAADLPVGLLLRDDDLGWKTVPVPEVPLNAVVQGVGASDLKGALLRNPVKSGTVLVATDVILPNAPGFLAATLKPGMLAISVAVDDVSGNAGLIQPGDYVDLLLTQQMTARTIAPGQSVSSETVVQRVRVLAVGSQFTRPKDDSSANTDGGIRVARTVTLEVTPRMSEVVSVASHLGSLSLALRSFATDSRDPNSAAIADTPPASAATLVWSGDVSRALHDLQRPASPSSAGYQAPRVMIYRGSTRSESGGEADGSAGLSPPLPTLPN